MLLLGGQNSMTPSILPQFFTPSVGRSEQHCSKACGPIDQLKQLWLTRRDLGAVLCQKLKNATTAYLPIKQKWD